MLGDQIKAKCRNCNQDAAADSLKLHFEYKMMVCPNCFRDFKKEEKVVDNIKKEPPKPPGWDAEDVYLEKAMQQKIEQTKACFKKVPNADYLMCTCNECSYVFKFYPKLRRPFSCPYCNGGLVFPNQYNTV